MVRILTTEGFVIALFEKASSNHKLVVPILLVKLAEAIRSFRSKNKFSRAESDTGLGKAPLFSVLQRCDLHLSAEMLSK